MSAPLPPTMIDDSPNRPVRRAVSGEAVILSFRPNASAKGGAYLMRGGIAWPRLTADGVGGYAVLCGRHVESGKIFVFEELPFVTVDWLRTGDVLIDEHPPVAPFFALAWHYYLSRTFYWRERGPATGEYSREVWACESINPKPILPKLEWHTRGEEQEIVRIFVADRQERLIYRPKGGVGGGIERYGANRDEMPVTLDALASALVGMGKVR